MWKEILKKVKQIEMSFSDKQREGASQERIKVFSSKIRELFGIDLPKDYLEFLSYVDGYDFNGFQVFGTSETPGDYLNMIEANALFHENQELKRYWFYGTSSLSWYVFDRESNLYLETDASETAWEQFKTFDELLTKIINDSLGE